MGTIKQGILGGFSGKVGGVVGAAWKGIAYMRALPVSVANPQSAGQIEQRTKFSNVTSYASVILATIIKPLWDRFAQGQSGYNAFISKNIALFEDTLPLPVTEFVISQGKMASTVISSVDITVGQKLITVHWPDDSGSGFKLSTDEVFLVVHNTSGINIGFAGAEAIRSELSASVTMAEGVEAGDLIRVYLAFRRADGTVVSDTKFKAETAT